MEEDGQGSYLDIQNSRDGVDGGGCFAAAAGRDNQIECAALERRWG